MQSPKIANKDPHPGQAFPLTKRTWIGRQLDAGEVVAVRRHVMEIYTEPLAVYCSGCSLRWVGEPTDLVAGFFADRLSRPAFLDRWRKSQRPLKFWLIVGLKHFLLEEARKIARDRRQVPVGAMEFGSSEPDRAFEQGCAIELVKKAIERCESECAEHGLQDHWDVFSMHLLHGADLRQIATARGLDLARAAVMKRTVSRRFRRIFRDLVSWEGADDGEIDADVRGMMESLG